MLGYALRANPTYDWTMERSEIREWWWIAPGYGPAGLHPGYFNHIHY
jgi:hypothetical protein